MKATEIPSNSDIVVYKGKAYKGRLEGNHLFISSIKKSFFSSGEKELKFNKLAVMNKHVYDLFVKNSKGGKIENVGIIGGILEKDFIKLKYILNFPNEENVLDISMSSKIAGGYGREIANEKTNSLVKKRVDIIGFYHSHPTRDTLSPADIKEFKKASQFDGLKEPIKFHILCRRSGIHRSLSKYVILPYAFYKSVTGKYKQIPIIITELN